MIDFEKANKILADKISVCLQGYKLTTCIKCRKYFNCRNISKLQEYMIMERRQHEHILGYK